MSLSLDRRICLLALPALLFLGCNPYWGAAELPPALCRDYGDCPLGQNCSFGSCALTGWASGIVQYRDPLRARPKALWIGVFSADDVLSDPMSPDTRGLGRRVASGSGGFRFKELPRGRLRLLAVCRSNQRIAGTISFVVDEGAGYVLGSGGERDHSLGLPVDLGYCGF